MFPFWGGREGPVCQLDLVHWEICCPPGAQVRGITWKLTRLVQPSDYYPLLIFHVDGNEAAKRSPRAIKRDFRAMGWLVKGSGAQLVFSSALPVAGNNTDIPFHLTQFINTWLKGWCHWQSYGFLNNGMVHIQQAWWHRMGCTFLRGGNGFCIS